MKIYKEQNDEGGISFSVQTLSPPPLSLLLSPTKPEVLNTLFHCCQQWQRKNQGGGKARRKEKKIIRQGKNIPWRNKLISLTFFSFPSLSMVIFFVTVIKY